MSGVVPVVEVEAKPWWMSRTLAFNVISFIVIVGGIVLDNAQPLALPDRWAAYLGVGIAIGNAWLRFQTTLPVAVSRGKRVELAGRVIDMRRE